MFLITIVLFLVLNQFNCSPVIHDSNAEIVKDLLNEIKNATSEAAKHFEDSIEGWVLIAGNGQAEFLHKTAEILDEIMTLTSEQIQNLEKEAEHKGPAGLICIKNAQTTLNATRYSAESYITCANDVINDAYSIINKGQSLVELILSNLKDLDNQYYNCDGDENCYGALIPTWEQNLIDWPQEIQDNLDWVDSYVRMASKDTLEINCEVSGSFDEECELTLDIVKKCIEEAKVIYYM